MRKLRHEEIPRADPGAITSLPRHPVRVLVENVRSIHNVGSIFRTADAAAVECLYLSGYTGTPDHPALHKTALGAQDVVPWEKHSDPLTVVDHVRSQGFTLAALEITNEPTHVEDLSETHFPLCLVIGNEVDGISDRLLQACDIAIEIPQYGTKQSLNVAVAFGIGVFDVVHRYRQLRLQR